MKILKQILVYLIWIVVAILLGICHMYFVLGPKETGNGFLQVIGTIIYNYALVHVGLYIGAIIALVFILLDVFYLKKKLSQHKIATITRFAILVLIAVVIGVTHYVLEKVIDVI
ncbi:hypothetical protein [Aurantibacter sp.]|uniref:hypothetical protein n=1 Tax=Aurantibacter sp. TaxID=2807103 RepID=UPI003264DC39